MIRDQMAPTEPLPLTYNTSSSDDAARTVAAGCWLLGLSLVFGVITAAPAFVVGAICVQKRRVVAGSVVMVLAPVAVAISVGLYLALAVALFDSDVSVFDDDEAALIAPTTKENAVPAPASASEPQASGDLTEEDFDYLPTDCPVEDSYSVSASEVTSCEFAERVAREVALWVQDGDVPFETRVQSPVTGKTYTMACDNAATGAVRCEGGDGAVVDVEFDA